MNKKSFGQPLKALTHFPISISRAYVNLGETSNETLMLKMQSKFKTNEPLFHREKSYGGAFHVLRCPYPPSGPAVANCMVRKEAGYLYTVSIGGRTRKWRHYASLALPLFSFESRDTIADLVIREIQFKG